MNLNHLKLTLTQIGILIKQVHKKNYAETCENLDKLIEEFGLEADRHCLRCLFSIINFQPGSTLHQNQNTQLHLKLLGRQLEKQLTRASVLSNICFALDNCFPSQKTLKAGPQTLGQIIKLTAINKLCECIVCLALTHSKQPEWRKCASDNLRQSLPQLLESYLGGSQTTASVISSLHDVSLDLLHLLLISLEDCVVPKKLQEVFIDKLRGEFPRACVPIILAPFLYPNNHINNNNSADIDGLDAFDILDVDDYTRSSLKTDDKHILKKKQQQRTAITLHDLTSSPGSATTTTTTANVDATNLFTNGGTTATAGATASAAITEELSIENIYENLCETIFTSQAVNNNIMETSWINLILEIGYEFTANVEECKNHLRCGGSREIQAQDVAKIIGLMCRRHTSLLDCNVNLPTPANFWPGQQQHGNTNNSITGTGQQNNDNGDDNNTSNTNDSGSSGNNNNKKEKSLTSGTSNDILQAWKPDVFVQALKEVVPQLNWKEVCVELDHPEFVMKDRTGLDLLLTIFRLGTQSTLFPYPECIYRHWKNVKGQLSLISTLLSNPDLFSFADYIYSVLPLDTLKTPPDTDNKEVCTWKSLHLIDVLLYIADQGFYSQVHELFKIPSQQCPDVLFLALLHINPPITAMRQDLFSQLLPTFLNNHPNSGALLGTAWTSTNFGVSLRPIIMHAMSEWYSRGSEYDQVKLSRILDVAQDLKVLSTLLNARSFLFVIDLACLASRREYLKLEKWLSDKIREHGEPFIQAIIKCLQRRCPQITNSKIPEEQLPPKHSQLPPDTVSTMLSCLQGCIGNVPPEVVNLIMQMSANCTILANKARAQQQQQQQQQQQPLVGGGGGTGGLVVAPQGVLRRGGPVGLDMSLTSGLSGPPPPQPFSANLNAQQMFGPTMDTLSNLTTNISGINLGGPNSSGTFNFNNMLGNLVSSNNAPGSPSRLMNPAAAASSYAAMQQMQAPPNVVGGLNRLPPPQPPTPTPTAGGVVGLGSGIGAGVMGEISTTISKEVEDEANSYFQRIYNHPPHPTLSIDEVLDILQRFKESDIRREQEVYQCMLRNLFEEYRFFPHYPDKELQITAQLFGGIIERNLVPTFVAMGLALRCVLDALRKADGSKMYYFGITALDRFKTRLHTYNKYCEYIRSIQHFQEFPPHLIQYVECGFLGQEPPSLPQNKIIMAAAAAAAAAACASASVGGSTPQQNQADNMYRSSSVTGNMVSTPTAANSTVQQKALMPAASRMKSIATATNIDTLLVANLEEKLTVPPEGIQDKTAFIFNNLSQLNIPQKCDEIKEIMLKEYWPWLSQYLVLKRASMEFNFHSLYFNFLEALKNQDINKYVTKETLRNIKVLLRSEKGVSNFSDRSLLKNLGHWLGMMTLARNKPILQADLDLKMLLLEAYHKGQQELLYVVPFVAKILESTVKSRVFRKPNPWTMAMMNVLGELHQEPDLKLNLKFEIEVLCKALHIELNKLKPIIYLKDSVRAMHVLPQMSQPAKSIIKNPPTPALDIQHQQQPSPAIIQQQQQQQQQQIANDLEQQQQQQQTSNSNASSSTVPSSPSNTLSSEHTNGQLILQTAEPPRFSYLEMNVNNFQIITQHLTLSANIGFLHLQPGLKHVVLNAIERTITEWLQPVVDRSVRIAATTTEQITRKDFALDADENRMRTAAHHMVRNLAASMAMITCKDQLTQSLNNNIRKAFLSALTASGPNYPEIDAAALQLTNDNVELACAFIQKTAAEKATPEIDRRLAADYETRRVAREENMSRYFDAQTLAYQTERLPEQVRLKIGVIPAAQFAVYVEFARNIPGFHALNERDMAMILPKPLELPSINAFGNDDIGLMYAELAAKIEAFLNATVTISSLQLQTNKMHALHNAMMVMRRTRDNETAHNLLARTVEGLVEGLVPVADCGEQLKIFRDIHLRLLSLLQNTFGAPITERAILKYFFELREEIRYNVDAVILLMTSHYLDVPQFDMALRDKMDHGNNYMAVTFAMGLIDRLLLDDRPNGVSVESEFINTMDMLARIMPHRNSFPESIADLIDMMWGGSTPSMDPNCFANDRFLLPPSQYIQSGVQHVRSNDFDDPPGLQNKTEYLLKDWVTLYSQSSNMSRENKNFSSFVQKMNMYGILRTDDLITRFFRQASQYCIDLVYRVLNDPANTPMQARNKIFHWIDAFVHLIALLVRHSGEVGNPTTKINLLNKLLGIVLGILLQDQEFRGAAFQQVGYHRFFIMLFLELNQPDALLESLMHSIVTAFSHTYHLLCPSKAPGFSYAWLELISHRVFLGRILSQIPQQKGWPLYAQLLLDIFKYLAPFLRNAELASPVQLVYKGTLRVLLVLLHDFPEFLCDYHFGFCDAIPPNCIQMRNIILAAYPHNMRLPDPFTPNLKVDMLAETASAPKICSNYVVNIQPSNFKKDLDSYLKARSPVTFLSELRSHLQISNEPGSRYNIALMNALVLYVGTQAIAHIRSKNLVPNTSNIAHSAHMDIFQNLAVDLDTEGRYLFLNAIVNQLRYPNSHTHYFSCAVLHLFAEANSEAIQEQITRVLLERLIVNRPHPWGLLITFIELIKNPIYKFWDHDFVHCAPEISKLFESVARSCMVKATTHSHQLNNSSNNTTNNSNNANNTNMNSSNIDGDLQDVK